jgi:putative aminopeptidase FrvX
MVLVDPVMVSNLKKSSLPEDPEEDGFRHFLPGDTAKLNIPFFRLGADAARLLFRETGIDLAGFEKKAARDLSPASRVILERKFRFSVTVKSESFIIRNVLGVIPGKDTTRNIIVGAHYDHLGVRKGEVFNGADDNASGTSGVLALAKAWVEADQKPSCNIIFAAWMGEEKGKLGSTWFARHSTLVPDRLSLVINLDMISRSAPEDTAAIQLSIGTKTENVELRNLAKKCNSKLERPFVLDLWDVTGATGSDYRPFADRKVPILTFHAGFPSEYHTPLDDFSRVDFTKMEQILRIVNDCLSEYAAGSVTK